MPKYNTVPVVLPSSGKTVRIPVDKDGFVPQNVLMEHFLDEGANPRRGRRKRDPVKDYDELADVIFPSKLTPLEAAPWWESPAEYDIIGIDAPGPFLTNTGRRKGKLKEIHKRIRVRCLPAMEEDVRSKLDQAFLPSELSKMIKDDDLMVEVRPLPGGKAGDQSGYLIRLDTQYGVDSNTIAHEGAHHLRAVDDERDNIITTTAVNLKVPYNGRSKDPLKIMAYQDAAMMNIEESCTVAEQMARSVDGRDSGYYRDVPVFDEKTRRWRNPTDNEILQMIAEDRMLFTYGKNKPLKEKAAIRSVNENWSRSHISRLKTAGHRRMAVNDLSQIDQNVADIMKENSEDPVKASPLMMPIATAVVSVVASTTTAPLLSRMFNRK